MTDLLLVLVVGGLGSVAGGVLRIPGGTMLGGLVTVAALRLSGLAHEPLGDEWSVAGQLLVGAAVGSSLDRSVLATFGRVIVPGIVAVGATMVGGVGVGAALMLTTDLGPTVAFFGAAPGGMSEMTAAAVALGASGPLVASMHLIRIMVVLAVLPTILHRATRSERRSTQPGAGPASGRDRSLSELD